MTPPLSEDFVETIEAWGQPVGEGPLAADRLAALAGLVPQEFIDFLAVYGECRFLEGRLQVCDPARYAGLGPLLFGQDPDFGQASSALIAYSAFGKMWFWNAMFGVHTVDIVKGHVVCASLSANTPNKPAHARHIYVPFAMPAEHFDVRDDAGQWLFDRARRTLGELATGECYGFVPLIGLGGSVRLEALKRLSAPEHLAIALQAGPFSLVDAQSPSSLKVVRPVGASAR